MRNIFENRAEDHFIKGVDKSIKKKSEDKLFDEFLLLVIKDRFKARYGNTKPKRSEFIDVYGKEEVENDGEKLKAFENDVEEMDQKKHAAEAFEAIVIEESMKSAWMGRNARVTPTNKFDDVFNKVDCVAEITNQNETQELGIAIDITFTKDENDITRKLDGIKKHIDQGHAPALIKYFKDKDGNPRKLLVPKVIIGCNADTLRELINLTVQKTSENEIIWKKAEHELNFHYFQTILLNEMLIQVKAFCQYAESKGQEKTRNSYYKAQKILEGIIEGKALYEEQIKKTEVKNDVVCNTINEYAKNLNK
jgi:hypothetical protein